MGNVSIKHQRKPIFEQQSPLSDRRYFDHREVVRSSRHRQIIPSSPISKRTKQSYSPIMTHRYIHKSAIKQNNSKFVLQNSSYLHNINRHLKDAKSNLYLKKYQKCPQIIQPSQYIQRLDTSRKTQSNNSQYYEKQRKQIMKKIRNFNQFINMVKKQIHETKFQNNSMKVKMQLQNQNFDISKYQQILQKQFSRQGSQAKVKFQDENQYKVVNISFEQPKQQHLKTQITQSSSRPLSNKQQLKQRMKQAAQRLRQLSQKFYEDNQSKLVIINQNITNIQNIIDNRQVGENISPHLTNINNYIKKMTDISKYQYDHNQKIKKDLSSFDQQSNTGSYENQKNF